MLGKVCGKLQIPRPGRGYWARKEFGKPVEKIPLPEAKDLPVLQRLKQAPSESPQPAVPTRQPTDPEYTRILEVEARPVVIDSEARRHKLVSETAKCLSRTQPDNRGNRRRLVARNVSRRARFQRIDQSCSKHHECCGSSA